jgi:hypothetical protein
MMNRTRIAKLVAIVLLAAPTAAIAGIHTWDVGEVFSNADGTIQFVEFVEAGGGNFEIGISGGSTSSNAGPKNFSWSGNPVSTTGFKRYLVGSQTFQNLTGAPPVDATIPLTFNSNPILPFFFQPASDTVNFIAYDSCPFTAIPTNGVGSFNCETNANQTANSPTNFAGGPSGTGSVIAALAPGLIDTFQRPFASSQNWISTPAGTNPTSGGPGGGSDGYLQLIASAGPLSAFNESQWAGVLPATADRIEADLNNSGPDPVSIRVMLLTPGCESGGTACTAWTSTNAQALSGTSGWVAASFSVKEADLTRVLGSDSYAASMANVERVLIRHDDGAPDAPNVATNVSSTLGVDNVELPEPSALLGLAAGALLIASLRRRS